jgi:hypothetical protein
MNFRAANGQTNERGGEESITICYWSTSRVNIF